MTPAPTVSFETADRLGIEALVAVWNAGFAGYYLDVSMSAAKLEQHVRRAGVRLEDSLVLLVGGERAGFSLLACEEESGEEVGGVASGGAVPSEERGAKADAGSVERCGSSSGAAGKRGWIGGFGIAPAHRGRGWAGKLIAEHLLRADRAGYASVQLEVIEHNPARRVYREAGFQEEGTLHSFSGVPDPSWAAHGMPLTRLSTEDLEDWHGPLHGGRPPTWRRDLPTLRRVLAEEGRAEAWAVEDDEGYPACALVAPGEGRIQILDAAAATKDAAHDLLAGLARIHPGQPFLLIDEPAESPLAAACAQFGLREAIRQVAMRWLWRESPKNL